MGKPLRATPCAPCPAPSTQQQGGPRTSTAPTLIHSRPSNSRLPPLAQYSVGPVAQIWIGADRWDQRPATSRRCGSSKQLAHPDRAVAGGTCRPGHRDRRRSTSQLDANVWGLSRWRRCLCRQADRHEDGLVLLRLGPIHDVCAHDLASWLQLCLVHPPTQQVGVDAVGHCHCGHRHARLRAGRHCIGLEIVTVHATPPATAGLLIRDSVHVSTKS